MTSNIYEGLLTEAQDRSRRLDTWILTTASVGLGVLGFMASQLYSRTLSYDELGEGIRLLGVVAAFSLIGSVILALTARPFVVPVVPCDDSSDDTPSDRNLHKDCFDSVLRWNRAKRWCLGSTWIGLMFLVVILANYLASGGRNSGQVFACVAAAVVGSIFVVACVRTCQLMCGRLEKKQKCLLRRGILVDLDGYQPRRCELVACGPDGDHT